MVLSSLVELPLVLLLIVVKLALLKLLAKISLVAQLALISRNLILLALVPIVLHPAVLPLSAVKKIQRLTIVIRSLLLIVELERVSEVLLTPSVVDLLLVLLPFVAKRSRLLALPIAALKNTSSIQMHQTPAMVPTVNSLSVVWFVPAVPPLLVLLEPLTSLVILVFHVVHLVLLIFAVIVSSIPLLPLSIVNNSDATLDILTEVTNNALVLLVLLKNVVVINVVPLLLLVLDLT